MLSPQRLLVYLAALVFSVPLVLLGQTQPEQNSSLTEIGTTSAAGESQCVSHRFWDRENLYLFAGVGAVRMLDYASTRHFRGQGNDEWLLSNSIVDNKPLVLGIEAAGTAASMGVSYLLHRTGHHKLERWVSIIHIGIGVGGAIRNSSLSAPAPPAASQ